MTASTEQERALYECISCNHLYGVAPSACDCCENPKNEYREWVALPKEKTARRAQVVQSVAGIQSGVIRGNPTFPKPTAPKAAPQPPDDLKRENPATKPDDGPSSCARCGNPWGEAAPVQLPDLDFDIASHTGTRIRGYRPETVRQLLAAQEARK